MILRNSKLTELSGLFIVSVIRGALTKCSYADQLNSKTIADEIIKLPADEFGNPNWNYMVEYMTSMTENTEDSLNAFEQLIH